MKATISAPTRSPGLSDREIAATVRHVLQWETRVHGTNIRASVVHVDDGKVTLEGRVDRWPDEHAIVDAIEHAPGVRQVIDHIRIEPRPAGSKN